MIMGFASPEFHPLIKVVVHGADGVEQEVEAWVDTGFDGEILLTSQIIARLGLTAPTAITVRLADGSMVSGQSYLASVIWNGQERHIQIVETQGHILVGIALLQDHQLNVTFTDGGAVTIEPLD